MKTIPLLLCLTLTGCASGTSYSASKVGLSTFDSVLVPMGRADRYRCADKTDRLECDAMGGSMNCECVPGGTPRALLR